MNAKEWVQRVHDLIGRGDPKSLAEAGNLLILAPLVQESGMGFLDEYRRLCDLWRKALLGLADDERKLVDRRTLNFSLLILDGDQPRPPRPSIGPKKDQNLGPIEDSEVREFLNQLGDEDAIRSIAVGADAVDDTGAAAGPVLVTIKGTPVRTRDIIPLYRPKVRIERPWSGPYVRWERAALEDSFLARAAVRGCLTSLERNRITHALSPYFRMPLGGRLTQVGLTLTKRLERWGYLRRVSRTQWRPTVAGAKAAREQLLPAWQAAGKPRER